MGEEGDERYDPLNPFTENSFDKLLEVLHGFGQCGYSTSSSTTDASWTGQLCLSEEDCGAGISCIKWSTFYGVIHFDEYGLNSEGDLLLVQLYDKGNDTIDARIIGPSTSSTCNAKGDCDNERDWSCDCESVYPNVYYWTPKISFYKYIIKLNLYKKLKIHLLWVLVIFMYYYQCLFFFLLCICFIYLTYNHIKSILYLFRNILIAEIPGQLYLLPLLSIFSMCNIFFYAIEPAIYVCFAREVIFAYPALMMQVYNLIYIIV